MTAYWIGLIFFASLQLFGLYSISNWAYLVFVVGLSSFCFGTLYGSFFSAKISMSRKKEYVLDYRLIYILYFIVILFLLYNFKNVMELLNSGYTWAKIRRLYSNQGQVSGYNEVTMSAFNVMMNQFVSTPTIYASLPIAVSDMLIGKKDKKLFGMTLIMMFLWMMTSGGRSIVLWLVLYLFFGIFIVKKRNFQIPKKVKKIMRYSIIPLIFVFVFITVQRKGESMNLLREAYIYFPVGLKNFDYHIQQFENSLQPYLGGASSFYGFIYPIIFILKVKAILVCLNRENVLNKNEELILEWYDLKWKVLDIGAKPNKQLAMKPTCLEKMVEYAEKLSKPFPFVRVDFYDRHEPILGEMTFTPMYGMAKYYSESGNKLLGSWLVLPDHKMKRKYKKED